MLPPPPTSTLFPYTTLFRSQRELARGEGGRDQHVGGREVRVDPAAPVALAAVVARDRKSTRLNSSHTVISYAVFCLKKKKTYKDGLRRYAVKAELQAEHKKG